MSGVAGSCCGALEDRRLGSGGGGGGGGVGSLSLVQVLGADGLLKA